MGSFTVPLAPWPASQAEVLRHEWYGSHTNNASGLAPYNADETPANFPRLLVATSSVALLLAFLNARAV